LAWVSQVFFAPEYAVKQSFAHCAPASVDGEPASSMQVVKHVSSLSQSLPGGSKHALSCAQHFPSAHVLQAAAPKSMLIVQDEPSLPLLLAPVSPPLLLLA
jgi:hypothetical protein